jgi:hypothetical protein
MPLQDANDQSHVFVIGRLRNNTTLSQAQAEMNTRCQWLDKMYPTTEGGRNCRLSPASNILVMMDPSEISIMRGVSALLQALVASTLIVVILNTTALFLAWGLSRKNEIAIFMALGCTRGKILRQLLAENIIVSLIGGVLGLFIASILPGIISTLIPELPLGIEIVVDTPVDIRAILFMLILCLSVGIIAGLIPAIKASNVEPSVLLAENDRKHCLN